MKSFPSLAVAACTIAVSVWSAPAEAQFAKPADAIKYRQAALTLIASHFGRIQPVVKGQAPYDVEQLKANVQLLSTLADLPWNAFGAGTEGGDARLEIWTDAADFEQKRDAFQKNIAQLQTAADSGDLDKVRVAFGGVGASCKSCHDSYRAKK